MPYLTICYIELLVRYVWKPLVEDKESYEVGLLVCVFCVCCMVYVIPAEKVRRHIAMSMLRISCSDGITR